MIIFPDNVVRRMAIFAVAVSLVAEVTISPTNLAHRNHQIKASEPSSSNFQLVFNAPSAQQDLR